MCVSVCEGGNRVGVELYTVCVYMFLCEVMCLVFLHLHLIALLLQLLDTCLQLTQLKILLVQVLKAPGKKTSGKNIIHFTFRLNVFVKHVVNKS